MKETRSTCCYCGVGCGVIIESEGAQITGVRGDPAHPANFGRLCSKGSTLNLTAAPHITQQARLLQPLHRPQRGGPLQAIGWDAALDETTRTYVERLESMVDEARLPAGDDLISEIERFLRERGTEDSQRS